MHVSRRPLHEVNVDGIVENVKLQLEKSTFYLHANENLIGYEKEKKE